MKYIYRERRKPKHLTYALTKIRTAAILPLAAALVLLSFSAAMRQPLSMQLSAAPNPTVDIESPAANTQASGTIRLIGDVPAEPSSQYDMFWYVDNGQWNWMSNGNDNTKQADIDLTNWHWHDGNNDYTIMVVAVMHDSGERVFASLPIHVGPPPNTPQTQVAQQSAASQLYVNPSSSAAQTAATTNDPNTKRIMAKLAAVPTATWLGSWSTDVRSDVAKIVNAASANQQLPVFVAYNIPDRDCGGYSAGGAQSAQAYQSWIQSIASGIGNQQALVILEPDALAQTSCLNTSDLQTRYQLLSSAVTTLKANPGTRVYIDAGNPTWIAANDMASRLQQADVQAADGFSLNVSNFVDTATNIGYGTQISDAIHGKHFIVDTSRNGNGSNGQWCNPSGRALGTSPTGKTGHALVDYYLWVKTPGESDGTCNGGPAAGIWWPEYAVNLAENAGW